MSGLADLHDELRDLTRTLLAKAGDGPAEWSRLAEAGWPAIEVPEQLDGLGGTFAEVAVVLEELGRAPVETPFFGTGVLGAGLLDAVEPSAPRDDLLRAVASGSLKLAVVVAASAEQIVVDPPFRLTGGSDQPTLSGVAEFVLDAPGADLVLLLARRADNTRVVVGAPPDRLTIVEQPLVDETRRAASLTADDVPTDDLVHLELPAEHAELVLDRAALAVAIDSLGLATAMLDATVAYVSNRHQFGQPVGSFQAVKHICADMLVKVSVARELVADAIEAVVSDRHDRAIAVSRAKSFTCDAAVDVSGSAMQLHGGIGYTWESGVHRYLKRATLNTCLFGSGPAHRRRLADELLRDP